MKSVLVFKTSVSSDKDISRLSPYLNELIIEKDRWNFDLEDCDNIFRVEMQSPDVTVITNLFRSKGYLCVELF